MCVTPGALTACIGTDASGTRIAAPPDRTTGMPVLPRYDQFCRKQKSRQPECRADFACSMTNFRGHYVLECGCIEHAKWARDVLVTSEGRLAWQPYGISSKRANHIKRQLADPVDLAVFY
jgi:hypothetical protein